MSPSFPVRGVPGRGRLGLPGATLRLLLIALLAVAVCAGCEDGVGPDTAVLSEPFDFQPDATGRAGFELTGVNGPITVTGVAGSESFEVSGYRRVHGCTESEAADWIDALQVEVRELADAITIETVQPLHTAPCSLEVEYELTVPARLEGRIVNVNGTVAVRTLSGGTTVTNVNGNVILHDTPAPVVVRLTNGSITAASSLEGSAALDLLTVNGNVDLRIPATTDAEVTATLVNGTISVLGLALSDRVQTATTLAATLGDGTGAILLRTTNGNITLAKD